MTSTSQDLVAAGRALERDGRWEEAAERYRERISTMPGDGDAWYRLGRVRQRQKDWVGAAQAYRTGLALAGGSARRYHRLGRALERCGAWEEARRAHQTSEALAGTVIPSLEGDRGRVLPHRRRIDLGLMRKPAYAHGLLRGAQLAGWLGIPRVRAFELGVAGGNGLLALEEHAAHIEGMLDIEVEVIGFDTGEGLLAPEDERDLPYLFAEGNYRMDEQALRERLRRARLVLGDARRTVAEVLEESDAPVAFVAFDMDLYSATRGVLDLIGDEAPQERFLPRIPVYFDDVVGKGEQDYNEFTGELLAIREFNEDNARVKIAEDRYFRTLPVNVAWHHGMHVMHRFGHPAYGSYVSGAGPESLALR